MPLKKDVVVVNFGQGVDTNTESHLVIPGKLLALQDAYFRKNGSIAKRNGGAALPSTAMVGIAPTFASGSAAIDNLEECRSMATYGDELLVTAKIKDTIQRNESGITVQEEPFLYSYSPTISSFAAKGRASTCIAKTRTIQDSYGKTFDRIDSAVSGNYQMIVASSSGGTYVLWVLFDISTELTIASGTCGTSGQQNAKVRALGGVFYIFWLETNTIRCQTITPGVPLTISSVTNLFTDARDVYDVCTTPTKIIIAYNVNGAVQIKCKQYNSALTLQNTGTLADEGIKAVAIAACAVSGSEELTQLAYQSPTNGMSTVTVDATMVFGTPISFEAYTAGTYAWQISLCSRDTIYAFDFIWQLSSVSSSDKNSILRRGYANASFAASANVDIKRHGLLFSKIFRINWSNSDLVSSTYALCEYFNSSQQVYFLLDVGRANNNEQTVITRLQSICIAEAQGCLVDVYVSDRTARLALLDKIDLINGLGSIATLSLDFDSSASYQYTELNSRVYFSGGNLIKYDGDIATEAGFMLFPEGVSLSQSAGGSLTALGTYQYCACYEWVSSDGKVMRSAPSVPVSITLTGGNQTVSISVPTISWSNIGVDVYGFYTTPPPIRIVVYRTETLGTTFYSLQKYPFSANSFSTDSVSVSDAISDATLITHAILYTDGGVLENAAPPPSSAIANFKNRIFLFDLDIKDQIAYSKSVVDGEEIGFPEEFRIFIESLGGDVVGGRALSDKLIIWKASRTYYLFGDGPNDLGEGSSFSEPILISSTIGCLNAKSIAEVPDGLIFQSDKGFYLIDGNLQLTFIGAPVDYFNTLTISSAVVLPAKNQVRWGTRTSKTLVYDYYLKQWSTMTNRQGRSATLWQNQYCYLDSTNLPFKEDTSFRDVSTNITLLLKTGWLSFAQIAGLMRVYKLILLAKFRSNHDLVVQFAYDYNPTIVDTATFTASTSTLGTFNEDTDYEFASPSVAGDAYEFKIGMPRQKIQAVQLTIRDSNLASSYESLSITSVSFEVGLKQGIGKLKSAVSL